MQRVKALKWVQRAKGKTLHRRIILDMDSSESPVYGEQTWQFPLTHGSPRENQTLVTSQTPRKTDKDRSKGCQAQQIHHVSNGRGCDRQEAVCRDIVPD